MFKLSVSLLFALGLSVPGQTTKPSPASVFSRVNAQNAIFAEYYTWWRNVHPEWATIIVDYSENDRLGDYSLEALAKNHRQQETFLSQLRAISTSGMPEQDRISHDLLIYALSQADEDYALKNYEMPVNQMDSPATDLADLPLSTPFNSLKDYQDYLARLKQIPRVLDETAGVLRAGQRDGLMPPRYLLEKVPAQCAGVVRDNPYLLPLKNFPISITANRLERVHWRFRTLENATGDNGVYREQ